MYICSSDQTIKDLFKAADTVQTTFQKILLDSLDITKEFHIAEVYSMETNNASMTILDGNRDDKKSWECELNTYGEITVDLFKNGKDVVIWLVITTTGNIFLSTDSNKVPDLFQNLDFYCKTYSELIDYVNTYIEV